MMMIKIKVKYRNTWFYASDLSIDKDGNISFEYLHGLYGCVDSEHVQDYKILIKEKKNGTTS